MVTGGAGFIGAHLVEGLIGRGVRVRVLDNLTTGSKVNLAGLEVELTVGDIRDAPVLERVMQGVDWVFHLAAQISPAESLSDPIGCYQVNLLGSLNVLRAALDARTACVVLASTAAVYGDSQATVVETSPTRPLTPYGASKLAMEGAARLFSTAYGLPTTCLRCFNVYGPRQSPDSPYAAVIPRFIHRMAEGAAAIIDGDGLQTRDFVYVTDVVEANLLAAQHPHPAGLVCNLGSGRSTSIRELAQTLHARFPQAPAPVAGPPRPGDIRTSAGDPGLAREALGFRTTVSLEQGLAQTVEWFVSQPRHEAA